MRTPLLFVPLLLLLGGCPPNHTFTEADVAQTKDLGDLMWAHAQACDPAFKKIGKAPYGEADYSVFDGCSRRIALTTARIEKEFSKGPEFNQMAETLASHGKELAAATAAKDGATASLALQAMKDSCKTCHKKFR